MNTFKRIVACIALISTLSLSACVVYRDHHHRHDHDHDRDDERHHSRYWHDRDFVRQ